MVHQIPDHGCLSGEGCKPACQVVLRTVLEEVMYLIRHGMALEVIGNINENLAD